MTGIILINDDELQMWHSEIGFCRQAQDHDSFN